MAALSINRNILECKVILGKSFDCRQSRINRNILECKVKWQYGTEYSFRSINRNILECKVVSANLPCLPLTVLIETYWNVKTCVGSHVLMLLDVLIETYWNVKLLEVLVFSSGTVSINRNILECKGFRVDAFVDPGDGINRNILECKEKGKDVRAAIVSAY